MRVAWPAHMRHRCITPLLCLLGVFIAWLPTGCFDGSGQRACSDILVEEQKLIGTVLYVQPETDPIETNFATYPTFQVERGSATMRVVEQGSVALAWLHPASAPPNSNPREFWLFMDGIDKAGKKALSDVRATFCTCAKGSNLNMLTMACQGAEDDRGHCEDVQGTLDITELNEECAASSDITCEEQVEMTLVAPAVEGKRFSGIIRWRSFYSRQSEVCRDEGF